MIRKDTASQGVYLFASDKTTGVGLAGDGANITGAISKDGAAEASFATANPTSIGGGIYWQPLSQAETNCNAFGMRWASSTADILIEPLVGFTDAGFNAAAISSEVWGDQPAGTPLADIAAAVWDDQPAGTPLADIAAAVWDAMPSGTPLADIAAEVWDTAPAGTPVADIAAEVWDTAPVGTPLADIKAQLADVLDTDTYAEPSAVPAATSSLKDKIGLLFAMARNKMTNDGSTIRLRNAADSADIAVADASESGGTFTRDTFS